MDQDPTKTRCHGILYDAQGRPIAGAMIRIRGLNLEYQNRDTFASLILDPGIDGDAAATLTTTSDSAGRFTVPRICNHWQVKLSLEAPGYVSEQIFFNPEYNDVVKDKQMWLIRGGVVQGRLLMPAGSTTPRVAGNRTMELVVIGRQYAHATTKVRADGSFQFPLVAPGIYQVRANFPHPKDKLFVQPELSTVEVIVNQTATITVPLSLGIPWRGTVTGARGEKRVQIAATLKTGPAGSKADAYPAVEANAIVAKDGTWLLYLPKPGEYELKYTGDGISDYRPVRMVTVQPNTPPEDVAIPLN